MWGNEAVWLDDQNRLAALLTRIHILPLEAVRDDLLPVLPALQLRAVQDRMADLSVLAGQVRPLAQDSFALVGERLVDGTSRAPIDNAVVVIRDGRISAAGGVRRCRSRVACVSFQPKARPSFLVSGTCTVISVRLNGGRPTLLQA